LLREGHDQYEVELVHADVEAKLLTVSIRGNQYEVQLKEDFDLLLEKMGMGPGNSTVLSKIKAPMPGMVLEIFVKTGQQVAKDDPLLILEAMKMENVIKSPRDGEIKSIGVIKGNAIEKNALLIEFQN
jgi:biotin carboxyl carrier protein